MQATTAPPATATHDYSAAMRAWHWVNATLVSGQLLTILFQKVIVNAKGAVPEFQAAITKGGGTLTQQQGRAVAHVISERIWAWHIWMGVTLAAFWLFWTVMQALDPAGRRFGARLMAAARRYKLAAPAEHADARHALLAKLTYAVFYLAITLMVITGLGLIWADDVAFLGNIEHTVKEVHSATMYVIIGYIVLHVAGVVWVEITKDHGLISRMVSGAARAKTPHNS
ncbi:cytochrome b/b6 domain-containing protein [Hymenobacter sp. H14-R3]|uniref:cytochrome b/b6 domain-containing protein n=1 Tax=Hymenobacter sp. H14-R3 TaxID=3046308 RepID=UPI0024B97119|nr:cytochrome b/b6 domain-containing protein [Hymenobacter sp. H14-R3]MDJ0366925.1 cytochrome b/b6 domain-containing protein [Hymenobacter sp. H14-R3]